MDKFREKLSKGFIKHKKGLLVFMIIGSAAILFLTISTRKKNMDVASKLNKEKESFVFKSEEKNTKKQKDQVVYPEIKKQVREKDGDLLGGLEEKEKKENRALINLGKLSSKIIVKNEKKIIDKQGKEGGEKNKRKDADLRKEKVKSSNFQAKSREKSRSLEGWENKGKKDLTNKVKTRGTKTDKSGRRVWVVDEKAVKEEVGYMWVVDQKAEPAKYKKVWVVDQKARPAWEEKGDKIYEPREYYQAENYQGKKSKKFPYSREGAIKASRWLEENGGGRYWNDIEFIFTGYEKIFHPAVKERGHWEKKLVKEATKEKGHWKKVVFVKSKDEKGHWEYR